MKIFKNKALAAILATSMVSGAIVAPDLTPEARAEVRVQAQAPHGPGGINQEAVNSIIALLVMFAFAGLGAYLGVLTNSETLNSSDNDDSKKSSELNDIAQNFSKPNAHPASRETPRKAPNVPKAPAVSDDSPVRVDNTPRSIPSAPASEYQDLSAYNSLAPDIETMVNQQFNEWNQYRVEHGLKKMMWNTLLADSAYRWAKYLADHRTADTDIYMKYPHEVYLINANADPAYIASLPAYPGVDDYAENVWQASPGAIKNALETFKKSPGHNKNLLTPDYGNQPTRVGIAIVKGGRDKYNRDTYFVVYRTDNKDR